MASIKSIKSLLTSIADNIRSLMGLSDLMNLDVMSNNLQDASDNIEIQSDLLDKIQIEIDKEENSIVNPPILENPGDSDKMAKGYKLYGENRDNIIEGNIEEITLYADDIIRPADSSQYISVKNKIVNGSIFIQSVPYGYIAKNDLIRYIDRTISEYNIYDGGASEYPYDIGPYAFYSCSALCGEVDVGYYCSAIGEGAFAFCSNMTSFYAINAKVIGSMAFEKAINLNYARIDDCYIIEPFTFGYCYNLSYVSIYYCTEIKNYAFIECSKLSTVSASKCISIGRNAFCSCISLQSVTFTLCETIGSEAFEDCSSLRVLSFPACTTISNNAFNNCTGLVNISFPACTSIASSAFANCTSLSYITLGASTVCTLEDSNAFNNTLIGSSTGFIYVPSSLVYDYKIATNWAYFSNRIQLLI